MVQAKVTKVQASSGGEEVRERGTQEAPAAKNEKNQKRKKKVPWARRRDERLELGQVLALANGLRCQAFWCVRRYFGGLERGITKKTLGSQASLGEHHVWRTPEHIVVQSTRLKRGAFQEKPNENSPHETSPPGTLLVRAHLAHLQHLPVPGSPDLHRQLLTRAKQIHSSTVSRCLEC